MNVDGVDIDKIVLTISQLADDTCLFLKNELQVPVVIKALDAFARASGLTINKQKCEIMTIHDSNIVSTDDIKVKKKRLNTQLSH